MMGLNAQRRIEFGSKHISCSSLSKQLMGGILDAIFLNCHSQANLIAASIALGSDLQSFSYRVTVNADFNSIALQLLDPTIICTQVH